MRRTTSFRWFSFRKQERKCQVMTEYLRKLDRKRDLYRQGAEHAGAPHREAQKPGDRASLPLDRALDPMINQYYVYAVDRDFGSFFFKFCRYFPFNAKLCLNGHECAKRQLGRQGIAFQALDNGVPSCANPEQLQ
jgi:hypothetical protein